MLASVYYKSPAQFVKKIRDKANEKFDLVEDEAEGDGDLLDVTDKNAPAGEYVDSTGVKRSEYLKNSEQQQEFY